MFFRVLLSTGLLYFSAEFLNSFCLSNSLAAQTSAVNAIRRITDSSVEMDILVLSAQCYKMVTNL